MKIQESISKAITSFGKEIITDERFVNILADYGAFNTNPIYRIVIRDLVNEGFTRKLFGKVQSNKDYEAVKLDLLFQIQRAIPFQVDIIEEVLDAILSCYLAKPVKPAVIQAPKPQPQVLHGSTKKEGLSVDDFFPIEGVHIGNYSWNDAIRDKFEVKKGRYGEYSAKKHNVTLWDWEGIGYFYDYQPFFIPEKWEELGFRRDLSYDEVLVFLKENNFTVIVKEAPSVGSWMNKPCFKAYLEAVSYDSTFQLEIRFDHGTYNGAFSSTRGTIYSTSTKLLNPKDYILQNAPKVDLTTELSAKRSTNFNKINDFTLGVTTYHDVKYIHGLKVIFNDEYKFFTLPNKHGTMYDKNGEGVFNEIRISKYEQFPDSWIQLGFCKDMSIREWNGLFKKMDFTTSIKSQWCFMGTYEVKMEYTSLDKSIIFTFQFKQHKSVMDFNAKHTLEYVLAKVLT